MSDKHTNPFLIYPYSVIASDLTQAQKAILCALITDCRKRKTDVSELYNRQIALLAGLKRGTVDHYMRDLKRKGYIQIEGFLRDRKIRVLKDYTGEQFLAVPVIEAKPATRLAVGYVQSLSESYTLVYPSNATGGRACGMSGSTFSAHIGIAKAAGLLNSRCVYDFEKLHWRRYLKLNPEVVAKAAISGKREKAEIIAELERWMKQTGALYEKEIPVLFALETDEGVIEMDDKALKTYIRGVV